MKHTLTTLILTLLVAFACVGPAHAQRFLSYEPEVVELDGQLVVQSKYGPPNFGEQPKTDQKVRVPVLLLSQPVIVASDEEGGKNSQTAYNVRQVQLAFDGSETSHKTLIGKPVVVTGTLFRAHTGHHYTDVVLNVQSIESKPAGYDQREFVVCRVNTSEWNVKAGYGTSLFERAEFRSPVNEDETLKSFKHAKSGLIINAGVQYLYRTQTKPPRPDEIRIALSVSNKEEDALHTSDNAVAGTEYGRNWGSLYVTKRVVVGDIEHTLTLFCFDRHAKWYKGSVSGR
ncbi:MAG TPA: DUF4431 domain-containing protein [Pyrinomonadaceae bacterium]|nr:DUF4431 domain-containing protein [Pyrinomonadaceae bacterium]